MLTYWLKYNHLESIRKYGIISHLNYVFNFNLSRLLIHMQMELKDLPKLEFPLNYGVREMDVDSLNEQEKWVSIVNSSYNDANETIESFHKHLYYHSFLKKQKVFFIYKGLDPNNIIGTVTAGVYKNNENFGGDSRIAILPSERGNRLGFFAVNYAFHYLKNSVDGVHFGETIISYHRTESLIIHKKIGFMFQFDRTKTNFNNQKRMWPIRYIAKKKLLEKIEKL